MKYTWSNLQFDLGSIESQIKESGIVFDLIVGIVRGGCVPAVILSHRLGIPVQMVHWSTRDIGAGIVSNESNLWIPEDLSSGKKILIVEDIIDTGLSIKTLIEDWQEGVLEDLVMENIYIATLINNTNNESHIVPNFIGREHEGEFVDFCWEM